MTKKISHIKLKKSKNNNFHMKKKKNKKQKTKEPLNEEIVIPEEEKLLPLLQQATAKKPRGKEKIHYVNSREFEEEIRVFYKTDFISIKLGESINKIAHGLSYAPNFINYSYKDDMIGDAIVKMVAALKNKKFKLDSGFSPFSYFTTIAFHAFINRIKKEKKHHETVNSYREKTYTDLMTSTDGDASYNPYNIYVDPSQEGDDSNYNATGT